MLLCVSHLCRMQTPRVFPNAKAILQGYVASRPATSSILDSAGPADLQTDARFDVGQTAGEFAVDAEDLASTSDCVQVASPVGNIGDSPVAGAEAAPPLRQ